MNQTGPKLLNANNWKSKEKQPYTVTGWVDVSNDTWKQMKQQDQHIHWVELSQ
jgi:hypothetical protein